MTPTMIPDNAHKDIPGNPSTAKSSKIKLNDRSTGEALRVLSEEDWAFWKHNGYIVIKNAVPREQAKATADFLWEFEEKDSNDQETWYTAARAEIQPAFTGLCVRELGRAQRCFALHADATGSKGLARDDAAGVGRSGDQHVVMFSTMS